MSKSTVKVVEINTDPAVKSLKDLRKELMEYKNQMTNLEEGSDAFLEIANKAGEVKHQIDEINESIKGASSDFGDVVGNVTNVAAGITGAFQAVAGGLQAMGIESKALDETIARMQGLMAVTQGLASIDTAIKSLDKLKNSITSTTGAAKVLKTVLQPKVFLAISAAIGAIALAWNKWGDELRNSIPVLDKFMRKWDGTAAEEAERIAEAQKKFNEELAVSDENVAKILKERKISNLTQEGKEELKRLEDDLKIAENDLLHWQEKLNEAGNNKTLWNSIREDARKTEERILNLKNAIDSIYTNPKYKLSNQTTKPKTREEEAESKTREERLKELDLVEFTDEDLAEGRKRVKEYWNEVYDIQLEQLKRSDETDKQKLEKEIAIEKERLENIKTYAGEGTLEYEKQQTKIYELQKELNEKIKEENLKHLNEIENLGNSIFNTIKESVSAFEDSSLGLTSGWISSLDQFQNAFTMTMDVVKKDGKKTWQDYGSVVTTALSGIGTILNSLSQEQDASTEEGFKKTKQFQIAATVMNMLSGIMNAWTSAMSPANAWMTVAGQIAMGTAMSGMVAGIGAAQIEKIKNATMSSANPNTNINAKSVNNMIVPPVQYSQAVQGASTQGAITNQRVVVVESDITNTIKAVVTQSEENTY